MIVTSRGVVRFRPPAPSPPPVFIDAVVADRRYEGVDAVEVSSTVGLIAFEFHGRSFKTRPEAMVYRYRLAGYDKGWKNTNARHVEYEDLPKGKYTFEVLAVDRDLVYSEMPGTVRLTIVPPFYLRAGFLIPTLGFGSVLLVTLGFLATALTKRRRQVHAYQQAAVQELQDAREIQMSLMPESSPTIEGFDIAGACHPARETGGDFFDYLSLPNGRIGIAIADVSGKGLRGAMTAVLTNGMLREVSTIEVSCDKILSRLNSDLHPRIEKQMFTSLGLAILNQGNNTLQWANAGQPYPLVKRGEQVFEFKSDGGLPLGMAPDVAYSDWELELQTGDMVIFYTDGVIEAENEAEEMYGAERLERVLINVDTAMSARETIETILQGISDLAGSAEQYDDMTVVVVRKV